LANLEGRFIWYELMTSDIEGAKAFYAKVVGWGMEDVAAPGIAYTLCIAGRASICGIMSLPQDARAIGLNPHWTGYVGVSDVDAVAGRIKKLGGVMHVPPTDIPGVSRFAVFADPQLATLGVIEWLRPRPQEEATSSALRRAGWHELLTVDPEQAMAFYGKLFAWQNAGSEAGPTGPYQLFAAAGETSGGIYAKPPEAPFPFWLYYFTVGDIDAAAKRVQAAGGQVLDGPLQWPDGRMTVACVDPQGAMFALVAKRRGQDIGYFPRGAA
jgi:uncharacterized protein